jgi:hypothetical protein
VLIRILVAPQHMKKGLPKAAALSDAERNGLSMFREAEATDDQIRAVAETLVNRAREKNTAKAGVFGVLRIRCGDIRRCIAPPENEPGYCVYDTALLETPSHAEAFQRVHNCELPIQDLRRNALFAKVESTFVRVQDFRQGLLADLAPPM